MLLRTCRLARLEAGDKDASDYLEWQQQLKQKAAAEEAAEIERKHLVGYVSQQSCNNVCV